jgi:hypothetical protein
MRRYAYIRIPRYQVLFDMAPVAYVFGMDACLHSTNDVLHDWEGRMLCSLLLYYKDGNKENWGSP